MATKAQWKAWAETHDKPKIAARVLAWLEKHDCDEEVWQMHEDLVDLVFDALTDQP